MEPNLADHAGEAFGTSDVVLLALGLNPTLRLGLGFRVSGLGFGV